MPCLRDLNVSKTRCRVQGSPRLIIDCIDIRSVAKEKLFTDFGFECRQVYDSSEGLP